MRTLTFSRPKGTSGHLTAEHFSLRTRQHGTFEKVRGIDVLYRDDRLVVINKPARLAVHRGLCRDRVVALTLVRDTIGQHVFPVHRLDRATSGALMFALDSEAAGVMNARFAKGEVKKRYLALVRGVVPDEGLIDHPVPRGPKKDRVDAVTAFRRIAVFENRYSVLYAHPQTGRYHQIRRHFKHLSHPLIGDVKYGKGEHNRLFRERFDLHRLGLHADQLQFECFAGHSRCVEAPLPRDFLEPLQRMGVWPATAR